MGCNTFNVKDVEDQKFKVSKILLTIRPYDGTNGFREMDSEVIVFNDINEANQKMEEEINYILEVEEGSVKKEIGYRCINVEYEEGHIEYIIDFIEVPIDVNFITVDIVEVA